MNNKCVGVLIHWCYQAVRPEQLCVRHRLVLRNVLFVGNLIRYYSNS